MHSSRMRTGRSLTVCCSLLPGGDLPGPGGFSLVWGGVPGPGGSPWSGEGWGVCLVLGGVFSLVPGGGALPAGGAAVCLVRGGSPWSGGVPAWSGEVLPGPGGGGSPWSGGVSAWSRGGSPETPPCEQNHRHV